MAETDVYTDIHAKTTKMNIHEVARRLNLHLGPTLVAALADVRDRKLPSKWSKADGPEPNPEAEKRLRQAHRIWMIISDAENDYVARAWFIGANPRLREETPIMTIRAGKLAPVMSAAKAFVEGTDD